MCGRGGAEAHAALLACAGPPHQISARRPAPSQIAMATIITFSVERQKPNGTLLSPPHARAFQLALVDIHGLDDRDRSGCPDHQRDRHDSQVSTTAAISTPAAPSA